MCAGSISIGMFLAGRVIAGIGSGILAVVVPMYQGEVATAETRGAMMCITGVMYAFGYSLAGWLGFACYFFPADSPFATFSWRFPLAMQVVAPLVVLAGSAFIPFSPRWLLGQDRRDEAFEIVKRLHAKHDDPNHATARSEFYLMEKQFELDKTFTMRPFEIFRTTPNLRRVFVACLLMWGNQFLGIFVRQPLRTFTDYLINCSLGDHKLWCLDLHLTRPTHIPPTFAKCLLDNLHDPRQLVDCLLRGQVREAHFSPHRRFRMCDILDL